MGTEAKPQVRSSFIWSNQNRRAYFSFDSPLFLSVADQLGPGFGVLEATLRGCYSQVPTGVLPNNYQPVAQLAFSKGI